MGKHILVHGSLAIDYIMDFKNNLYKNAFIDNDKQSFSMAIMPSTKKMQYGGTAGNIAHNLGQLKAPCEILTSVGVDFESTKYKEKLASYDTITLNLIKHEDGFCANCYIVNDIKKQQLIVYHGGVTQRIPNENLKGRGISGENISWAINSPENPLQMIRVSQELDQLGINCILDTGQVTPAFSRDDLINMIKKSKIMISNENEFKMISDIVKLGLDDIKQLIETIIITKGENGSCIYSKNKEIDIPIVEANQVLDPTGAGDGYRAGLLGALHQDLPVEYGCKLGATMASFVVETIGAQTHQVSLAQIKQRFEEKFEAFKYVF
ncbi:MAG: hypothetical protein GF364_01795 [Candidatus Lokiarchaeota archaeon]|nr:hypothetical protein [Candidatus Lokiarchaeota archaeon]